MPGVQENASNSHFGFAICDFGLEKWDLHLFLEGIQGGSGETRAREVNMCSAVGRRALVTPAHMAAAVAVVEVVTVSVGGPSPTAAQQPLAASCHISLENPK
jgi:hypothetical protein